MKDLATIAAQSLHESQAQARAPREASPTIRKLFVLLHGSYGNPFLAKFNTGQLVESGPNQGKDKGMLAAMLVWDADLSHFPGDVIEAAVKRAKDESPEFAPTLPKLVKLCEAIMPRKTHFEEQGLPMLPAPKLVRVDVRIEPVGDGKDQYRKIWARHLAGDKTLSMFSLKAAIEVLGAEAQAMKQEAQPPHLAE